MECKVQGTIIQVLEPQSGISKAGKPWKSQEFVMQTADRYPKKIAFTVFNDKVDHNLLNVGSTVEMSFDIDSREYNGRWYVTVSAYACLPLNFAQPQTYPQSYAPNGIPQQGYPGM